MKGVSALARDASAPADRAAMKLRRLGIPKISLRSFPKYRRGDSGHQKNSFIANWKLRGPPVLKIGLNPAPLLDWTPRLLFAMLVVVPNATLFRVPFCGPKLG